MMFKIEWQLIFPNRNVKANRKIEIVVKEIQTSNFQVYFKFEL